MHHHRADANRLRASPPANMSDAPTDYDFEEDGTITVEPPGIVDRGDSKRLRGEG